jgi:enoyl-CoA hydratase/carnithine racemase
MTATLSLEEYAPRFRHVRFERRGGVLQLSIHTDGNSLRWAWPAHDELGAAFRFVAADRENKVVILTGTGEEFTGPRVDFSTAPSRVSLTPEAWDVVLSTGRELLMALLDIEVPVIAAVNGPAYRHAEIPFLCDIVIAAEDAVFEDKGHVPYGLVSGDGYFAVTSLLMGLNRARYYHLTGSTLDAAEALRVGLVSEVLAKGQVLARAWSLAEELAQKQPLLLRSTRMLFTFDLKKRLLDHLSHGLALEGLAQSGASSGFIPPRA